LILTLPSWFLVELCGWIERGEITRQSRDVGLITDLPFSVVTSDGFDVDASSPPTDTINCGRLVQSSKIDEINFIYLQNG
jgi:hypothetical protein